MESDNDDRRIGMKRSKEDRDDQTYKRRKTVCDFDLSEYEDDVKVLRENTTNLTDNDICILLKWQYAKDTWSNEMFPIIKPILKKVKLSDEGYYKIWREMIDSFDCSPNEEGILVSAYINKIAESFKTDYLNFENGIPVPETRRYFMGRLRLLLAGSKNVGIGIYPVKGGLEEGGPKSGNSKEGLQWNVIDGRHRFLNLRDWGLPLIPMIINSWTPENTVEEFNKFKKLGYINRVLKNCTGIEKSTGESGEAPELVLPQSEQTKSWWRFWGGKTQKKRKTHKKIKKNKKSRKSNKRSRKKTRRSRRK